MKKGQYLEAILRSPKTVFGYKDIALLWGEPNSSAVRVRLGYYVRQNKLYRIRRGLYAKNQNYKKLELATRIFTPSYVSFETVLSKEAMIFQFYNRISAASYLAREIEVDGQGYTFRRIKASILTNTVGVEHRDETSIATRERAFLDILYLNTDYHFDNLGAIDWSKVFDILPIYGNGRMSKKVMNLYGEAAK